jgi:ribulose 1,5-bisphosphate carboxylase large subunit-like protein
MGYFNADYEPKDTDILAAFRITPQPRSESLALVQLLILYQLVTARAAVALGGDGTRNARKAKDVGTEAEAGLP